MNLLLDYENVRVPPLHPNCNCETVYSVEGE
jgi:hypothetical protein